MKEIIDQIGIQITPPQFLLYVCTQKVKKYSRKAVFHSNFKHFKVHKKLYFYLYFLSLFDMWSKHHVSFSKNHLKFYVSSRITNARFCKNMVVTEDEASSISSKTSSSKKLTFYNE